MNHEDIMDCLKEQLGKPIIEKKKVEENKLFILDGIMAGDLPVYRKWEWVSMIKPTSTKWLFRIDIVEGRLQVDRIKFEDKGRIEFDTQNHCIILDSEYKEASEDDWKNGVHKLMKYIRNGI